MKLYSYNRRLKAALTFLLPANIVFVSSQTTSAASNDYSILSFVDPLIGTVNGGKHATC